MNWKWKWTHAKNFLLRNTQLLSPFAKSAYKKFCVKIDRQTHLNLNFPYMMKSCIVWHSKQIINVIIQNMIITFWINKLDFWVNYAKYFGYKRMFNNFCLICFLMLLIIQTHPLLFFPGSNYFSDGHATYTGWFVTTIYYLFVSIMYVNHFCR